MRRRLFTLAIFLLLGAVVNVAVAWGCATWSAVKLVSMARPPTDAEQRWWQRAVPAGAARRASMPRLSRGFGCDSLVILGNRSGQAVFQEAQGENAFVFYTTIGKWDRATLVRSGWPWRSGAGERWDLDISHSLWPPGPMLGDKVTTWRDADLQTSAVSFDRPTWLGGSSFRLLPLRPVWPGFAVNTVFYAAILWPLISGPFALRRLIRRKRGLCVACGYDLSHAEHDACPECGAGA